MKYKLGSTSLLVDLSFIEALDILAARDQFLRFPPVNFSPSSFFHAIPSNPWILASKAYGDKKNISDTMTIMLTSFIFVLYTYLSLLE